MLTGPNVEGVRRMVDATGMDIIASGGMSAPDDVRHILQTGAGGRHHRQGIVRRDDRPAGGHRNGEKDMLTKRIIPCLDVHAGRVVKGVNFVDIRDAGDPVELAKFFNEAGADELVFLDITASSDERRNHDRRGGADSGGSVHPADGGRRHPHGG